ncbi:hypothetical protein [Amphritea sp.]|uniref:hypothetical protein n=1 Tax=Amphritea sp. TaxID=1872502 RepID=UPI003A92729F
MAINIASEFLSECKTIQLGADEQGLNLMALIMLGFAGDFQPTGKVFSNTV